jgi:hypothetical protein
MSRVGGGERVVSFAVAAFVFFEGGEEKDNAVCGII